MHDYNPDHKALQFYMGDRVMLNGSYRWGNVPSLFTPIYHSGRNVRDWWFSGQDVVPLLLTVPRMRNRCFYFKLSPYLNLLLPFSPPFCRSVAKGFSLMTLRSRRSEPRHISPFQFPFFLPLYFLFFLPTTQSHLPPVLQCYLSLQKRPQHQPVDVVGVWPEAGRDIPCLIE